MLHTVFARGVYCLKWPIRGVPLDRVRFLTSALLNGVCNFERVCANYKRGIACTIDLICQMKFFCTRSVQKQLLKFAPLQLPKQDGVHFVLHPKEGNQFEGVVLNRVQSR